MRVIEYREIHKRCRTCQYADERTCCWFCKAKNFKESGSVFYTKIKGCFCKLYRPKVGIENE